MEYLNASYHYIDARLSSLLGMNTRDFTINWLFSEHFRFPHWLYLLYVGILLFILSFVIILLSHIYYRILSEKQNSCIKAKRVLFVMAHPDDECMFFGPTIVNLTKRKNVDVRLICLSEGNFYGEGGTRTKELWNSCKELGIPKRNIRIISNKHLPDDPQVEWDSKVIGSIISWHVAALSVDTLVSFDDYGVSGHRNHIAISHAINILVNERTLPSSCKCYALKSENIFLKYIGFLIIIFRWRCGNIFVNSFSDYKTVKRAMTKHVSQYVWFRKLFIIFSSYCYLNTLICIRG